MSRRQALDLRLRAQQLGVLDAAARVRPNVLDLGVQYHRTSPVSLALALRGRPSVGHDDASECVIVWAWRGAPHAYLRAEASEVLRALAPFSEADAGARLGRIGRVLRDEGIDPLVALDTTAAAMRQLAHEPLTKGALSGALTPVLPPAYLVDCQACRARHPGEMLFRLAATRAGLELVADTSPPVLAPISAVPPPTGQARQQPDDRHEPVRALLRLYGPLTPRHAAEFLESPLGEIEARWPTDAHEVDVDGQPRWYLPPPPDAVPHQPAPPSDAPRPGNTGHSDLGLGDDMLLGAFDPYLQARDRDLLVAQAADRKSLWPTLGRPGAVLSRGELVGTWRATGKGSRLEVSVRSWAPGPLPDLHGAAELVARARGLAEATVTPG